MYGWEQGVLVQHYLEQGLSKTAIAEAVGVSRRTVHYWLARGKLDAGGVTMGYPQRVTKLDPYKPIIDERLAVYPELSAVRLFDEVRAAGYDGSLTQLKVYVRQVRPRRPVEDVVRFETPPGKQAQVDFATVRLPWGTRYALLVVLGYSRLLWLQFYPRQTLPTLCRGLEDAFAFFRGVPHELLFDQLKAVVVDDRRPDGGKVMENPEFLRFAAHWGFRIRACRPYRAKTKGKVERPIRYVRGNFLYGREFLGDADLNARALTWLEDTANVRLHGTTKEQPVIRYERDERATLQPLAARPYRSLLEVTPRAPAPRRRRPTPVRVEQRSLHAYAALVGGAR